MKSHGMLALVWSATVGKLSFVCFIKTEICAEFFWKFHNETIFFHPFNRASIDIRWWVAAVFVHSDSVACRILDIDYCFSNQAVLKKKIQIFHDNRIVGSAEQTAAKLAPVTTIEVPNPWTVDTPGIFCFTSRSMRFQSMRYCCCMLNRWVTFGRFACGAPSVHFLLAIFFEMTLFWNELFSEKNAWQCHTHIWVCVRGVKKWIYQKFGLIAMHTTNNMMHIIDILLKSMLEKNSMTCYSMCVCLALRIFSFFYFLQPKQYRKNRRVEPLQ